MKNITVSFRVSDQKANALKNFVSEYKTFPERKKDYVFEVIKRFLISWDPNCTEDIPDERIKTLIGIFKPIYLLLGIEREESNFKFEIEDVD